MTESRYGGKAEPAEGGGRAFTVMPAMSAQAMGHFEIDEMGRQENRCRQGGVG